MKGFRILGPKIWVIVITLKVKGLWVPLAVWSHIIAILWLFKRRTLYVIRSCSRYNWRCSCRSLVWMPAPSSYRTNMGFSHDPCGWLRYIYRWNLCIYGRFWGLHKGCFSCLFNFDNIFCQKPSHSSILFPVAYCFWTGQYLESMLLSRLLSRDPYNGI